jgi:hypothetical protein
VTRLDPSRDNETHRWPFFLPGGRRFLFFSRYFTGAEQSSMISVGTLEGGTPQDLFQSSSSASYARGHLLFQRGTTLMAQPFDTASLELRKEPVPIAEKVQLDAGFARGIFTASEEGTLIYQTGSAQVGSQLVWHDRSGVADGHLGERETHIDVEISPDGRSVAASSVNLQVGPPDIWIHDVSRDVKSRFTFQPRADRYPVWSPDGTRIAFRTTKSNTFVILIKDLTGPGEERLVFESPGENAPTSWSRDGRLLLLQVRDPNTRNDLWVLPLSTGAKPEPFLQSPYNEESGRFSPDGKWIAYASNESGRYEINVTAFPGPGRRWQVSAAGGTQPRWSPDGKEVFFLSAARHLMAAPVQARDGGLEIGPAKPVLEITYQVPGALYDVSPDGRRLLVITSPQPDDISPLTLRLNWLAAAPNGGESR